MSDSPPTSPAIRRNPETRRSIELDVADDELWHLLTDPAELATWLGDEVAIDLVPGGAGRVLDDQIERDLIVEQVIPGERIAWRWWPHDEPGSASRVEIVIAPHPGGTRVEVIETLLPTATPVTALAAIGSRQALRWEVRLALIAIGAAASCLAR